MKNFEQFLIYPTVAEINTFLEHFIYFQTNLIQMLKSEVHQQANSTLLQKKWT